MPSSRTLPSSRTRAQQVLDLNMELLELALIQSQIFLELTQQDGQPRAVPDLIGLPLLFVIEEPW